ncbi:MAG: hypothetical protein NTW14_01435 [bacterium]|nr:hypothetical protein [bacterium]
MVQGPYPHCSIVAQFGNSSRQHPGCCEHCSVPLMILDVDGSAIHINEALKLLWDISPEKVLSEPRYNLYHDFGLSEHGLIDNMLGALEGKTFHCELPKYCFPSEFFISESCRQHPRNIAISLIPSILEGKVQSLYLAYHDESRIHDVKKLQRSCTQLATIASSVNDLKHDLNNPLLLIIGNAQLLLSKSSMLSEDVINKLEKILKAADRMKGLLEQYHTITSLLEKSREVEDLVATD